MTGFSALTSLISTNLFPFIFYWSVKNFALIAHPRCGLTAIQKLQVYCIESAPGRSEIQTLKLGRCRLSEDLMYSLGTKMGFYGPDEMQSQVLKWFGIRGKRATVLRLI